MRAIKQFFVRSEKPKSRLRRLIFGSILMTILTFVVLAHAGQVDNPPCTNINSECTINVFNDSKLYWASGDYIPFGWTSSSDGMLGYFGGGGGSGAFTYDTTTASPDSLGSQPEQYVNMNGVTISPIISSSSTAASFDLSGGQTYVSVTLRMKLRINWSGFSGACDTPYFTFTATTTGSCTWCGTPSGYNYDTSGGFKAVASGVTIGAITTGCVNGSNISQFNGAYNFDGSSGHDIMVRGRMNTPSILSGS
jgi:hypothetical protein